jgi:hypothetical protein
MGNSFPPYVLTRVELGIISHPQELWARHLSHDTHSASHFYSVPNNQSTLRLFNHWHIPNQACRDICLIKRLTDMTKYTRLLRPLGTWFFRFPSFRSTPIHQLVADAPFRLSTPDLQTAGCSWLLTSNLYQLLFAIRRFTETTARFTVMRP